MSPAVAAVACGPYELCAQEDGTLLEHEDGSVELYAERSYLVKLAPAARRDVLRGALRIPRGGSEGTLRFENFIGLAMLGPRRLDVRSRRLDAAAVDGMLDEVRDRLASLPFAAEAPTRAAYERVRDPGPTALYHTFAFLRDCMRGRERRLPAAIERVLARPHESLRPGEPRLVPIGAVSRFDAEALGAIQSEPELLRPVAEGSPLATHPVALALGGAMPELVRTRPIRHSTDNPENRFVVGMLEAMVELLRRFERLVAAEGRVSAALNARQAREIADALGRYLRHRVLDGVPPRSRPPLHSALLRARPGYRELLGIHAELLARTGYAHPDPAQALLELRDAATIYEYWCYFQVLAAATNVLGEPLGVDRFAADDAATRLPWGYRARWPSLTVSYNETFPHSPAADGWPGATSYSLPLRPDIAVRAGAGELHLFDAKLKLDFGRTVASGAAAAPAGPDGFRHEDLHKMHAYRDALGAGSVWVLYPSADPAPARFPVPGAGAGDPAPGFRGVGAIPLRPGAGSPVLAGLLAELAAAGSRAGG
jgi:predicted component of viral defense system (DUF524 family)